jgi:hypothetical protein
MGSIRLEVRDQHLTEHPEEEEILKAFLPCFFVTWGRLRKAYNTELSVYFLNPEPFMKETFGFDQEVMLVYSKYDRLEPRALQAAESFMADDPARGRVEKLTYFFVSESPDTEQWFHSYTSVNPESKLIIPIAAKDLRSNASDAWFVRNKTAKLLYGRDLFDYRLPLEQDTYFFGRSELVVNLFDAIKRAENRGIFGLRKTGKTSLLYKLERMLKADKVAEVFYYDCKLPSIRKLRWFELLNRICKELATCFGLSCSQKMDEVSAADNFMKLVSKLTKPALLIFDEIEYISPVAIDDQHWHKDFVDFWQTFWACQSRYRRISAMIAGVNPSVVEMDSVGGIQNPLFGIVSYQFLTGLNPEETRNMIRTLGKRIGIKFEHDAAQYIHKRYGGHPLLTRMGCSTTNSIIKQASEDRPVTLTLKRLQDEEAQRDTELMFYCRHVVSELKQFYPDEYEMLELLASGQIHDFIELAAYPEYTKHLRSYGLLGEDSFKRPVIAIPVIGRYVGLELARREGRQTLFRVIPKEARDPWIQKRKDSIFNDLHLLERAIKQTDSPKLFGPNSFPKADEFAAVSVVNTEKDFKDFIDTCNRCFVESIENYGGSIGKPQYYWQDIKTAYPGLWHAIQRIKIYRHDSLHLVLNKQASEALLAYLKQDLEDRNPSSVRDRYFILQQCVLDGFLTGIQIEINSLT